MKITQFRKAVVGTSVVLTACLVGCTSMRDLSVSEFRTKEFFDREVVLNNGVQELSDILVSYQNNCKKIDQITMNPDKKSGVIAWQVGGFSSGATMAVLDFEEEKTRKVTHVKVYSANIFWKKRPEDVLKVLQSGGKCE
jgi:hypothetical protein